ncbi:MAG: 4Fe-4S binding protein [Planctomycetota bacterium]
MATRKIVQIDEEKCDGCGQCVTACAEGAIQMVNGKARLVSDTYCDGLGACLGECPQGAITIEERDAADFDEQAVKRHLATLRREERPRVAEPVRTRVQAHAHAHSGCPGAALRSFAPTSAPVPPGPAAPSTRAPSLGPPPPSQLGHWPVQLSLVPPGAPFLRGADLLVCADCVPFTVPDFHTRYLAGGAVLVGCPKLDNLPYYVEKLKAIFAQAQPRRITVLRMEVPCCGGIAQAALEARNETTPQTAFEVHIIGVRGGILAEEQVPAAAVPH